MTNYIRKETDKDGAVRYYNDNNKLHRLDGPAVEYSDGNKAWYVNGKLHRLDGPAVERANGYKTWYVNGKLHRLDGPAFEGANGYKVWWVDGEMLTEQEFNKHPLVVEKRVNRLISEVLDG